MAGTVSLPLGAKSIIVPAEAYINPPKALPSATVDGALIPFAISSNCLSLKLIVMSDSAFFIASAVVLAISSAKRSLISANASLAWL